MICQGIEVQAHHLLRAAPRGMGLKAGDNWVVPLCYYHHSELHRNGDEVEFFELYGWDYEAVKNYATGLWDAEHYPVL